MKDNIADPYPKESVNLDKVGLGYKYINAVLLYL